MFSQEVTIPQVKIKDHNGTSGLINVDCEYDSYPIRSVRLIAEYPTIGYPNDYTVKSINYTPVVDFSAGQLIHIEKDDGKRDDTFGSAIKMPFEFCFYGVKYNKLIISDNGVVSFDTSMANKENPWKIAGNIPNTGLPKSSIFGVYHDMHLVDANNKSIDLIKVSVQGTAPYRKFVVNYENIPQFSSNRRSTSQIVLYETVNVIDVYVKEKSFNTTSTKERKALIGITNASGTVGISPPGRNTGEWEAHEEAWRFLPSGNTTVTVQWYENNKLIGTGNPITKPLSGDTRYKAVVTYNLCSQFQVSDEIGIKFSPDHVTNNNVTMDIKQAPCIGNNEKAVIDLTQFEQEINSTPELTFTYYDTYDNAYNGTETGKIQNPKQYEYSKDKVSVYVRVFKGGICYAVSTLQLRINKKPVVENGKTLGFCDYDGDGVEKIHLITQVAGKLSGFDNSTMDIKFYLTENDAQTDTGEIINYTNFPLTASQTLFIKVWNKGFDNINCYGIYSVTLNYLKKINVKDGLEELICWTFEDQKITVDLTQYLTKLSNSLPSSQYKVRYYWDANHSSEITKPTATEFALDRTIYFQIKDVLGICAYNTYITFKADGDCDGNSGGGVPGIPGGTGGPGGSGGTVCGEPGGKYTVNLAEDYLRFYLPKGMTLNDVEQIEFYEKSNGNLITKTDPYSYTFTFIPPVFYKEITAKYKIKVSGVIAALNFPIIYIQQVSLKTDNFIVCHNSDTGSALIHMYTLDERFKSLYKGFYTNVLYFKTEQDASDYMSDQEKNKNKIITSDQISVGDTVEYYALVEVLAAPLLGCWYKYKFSITVEKLRKEKLSYTVCDFWGDKKEKVDLTRYVEDIKTLLNITNTTKYDLGYSVPNPSAYEMTASPFSVFVTVMVDGKCFVQVELELLFTTTVALPDIEDTIYICDDNGDDKEELNLNTIISNADKKSKIYFYNNNKAAETGGDSSPYYIGTYDPDNATSVNYSVNQSAVVYVRIDDENTGCFKVLPVSLSLIKINDFPNRTISVCDYGTLGSESIPVSKVNEQLIENNKKEFQGKGYSYAFYLTYKDAQNGSNELTVNFPVTAFNPGYVKITTDKGGCSRIFELNFNLVPPPVIHSPETYYICNNNTKNDNEQVKEIIDLNPYNPDFITTGIVSDYTFTYYYDDKLTNLISKNSATITKFPTTLWVKVTHKTTGCYSAAPFTFAQYPTLEGKIKDDAIVLCSDSEEKLINIKEHALSMIVPPATVGDFTITYHHTKAEAVGNANSTIPQNLIDEGIMVSDNDFFHIKYTDNKTGCFVIRRFDVTIHGNPKSGNIFPYICDESDGDLDDRYVISNLDDYKTQIIIGEPNLDNLYNYTYYKNLSDAEKRENPISRLNLILSESDLLPPGTPGDPYFYQVWVRVDKKDGTGCYSITAISFNVNPKVSINTAEPEIMECDESDADGKTYFDLTSVSGSISSASGMSYIYYETLEDAQTNTNAIPNPSHWKNPTPYEHRVYVRVQRSGHCDNLASIKTLVYPYINVQDRLDVKVCEFESDGKTPSRVDLSEEVKFMYAEVNALPGYPNLFNDLDISLHTTLPDAESTQNPIPFSDLSSYLVPVGKTSLWVRFQSKTTKCYQIRELRITKTPAPALNPVSHLLCDDNLDEVYDIVLNTLDKDIPVNTGNYEISYHESAANAEMVNGVEINKDVPYTKPYTDFPKTLYIRVKNLDTGCVRTSSLEIRTNPKITVSPEVKLTACDGDNDGFAEFDLTLVQNAISTESDITYTYFLSLDDAQKNQNPITAATAYTTNLDYVYVRVEEDPGLNTRCPSLSRIKLQTYYPPNPLPKEVSICPRSKTILDAGDFDEYLWNTGETTREITVGEAGIYTVTVTRYLNYGLSCPVTFQVEVKLFEEPVITDLQEGADYITVIAKGAFPLEYSMDNKH
ncbi:MAG: hypothetical protein LBP34_00245, partial [Flavobacteriaceae bacterium]|nr:hypothetical protein [Flavobacteriaceae bacterium]